MASKNQDFDFNGFAIDIIKSIDAMRSDGKDGKGEKENRISAFYRAIGLPGVLIKKDSGEGLTGDSINDLTNSGNLIDKLVVETDSLGQGILFRQMRATTLLDVAKDEKRYKGILDINNNSILASIDPDIQPERPKLLPLYVDAGFPIFGKEKRISPAFIPEKMLIDDKVKYTRPLIESIISMRLSGSNSLISSGPGGDVALQQYREDLSSMSKHVEESLVLCLENINQSLSDIKKKVDSAKKQLNIDIIPPGSGNPEQSQEIEENEESTAELDVKKRKQELYLAIKRARLSLMNFDDSFFSEKTKNLKTAALMSSLLKSVVSDNGIIEQELQETNDKIQKKTQEIKNAFKELDLILGIYSGLSGVDAIIIVLSLFKIDIKYLIGLLNEKSRKYLFDTIGYTIKDVSTTEEAIDFLGRQIRYWFIVLEEIIRAPSKRK